MHHVNMIVLICRCSNDQSPPHCRMVSLETLYQPVDKNETVFCAPLLCLYIDLATVSQEQPWYATIYCLYEFSNAFSYDNFCSPLLNTFSHRTLVIDFSLSFGFTGPGYSMPSSARSSAKQAHVGVKKTSTPIFLTCSTH